MQSPGICPALQGHFHGQIPVKSPAQIPAGECEIVPADLSMESKALLRSNMAVNPSMALLCQAPWRPDL